MTLRYTVLLHKDTDDYMQSPTNAIIEMQSRFHSVIKILPLGERQCKQQDDAKQLYNKDSMRRI